jgi:hypothetical protein
MVVGQSKREKEERNGKKYLFLGIEILGLLR